MNGQVRDQNHKDLFLKLNLFLFDEILGKYVYESVLITLPIKIVLRLSARSRILNLQFKQTIQ